LRSGHLEAFPNCKSYSKDKPTDYNGHRLPLQTGSYWLDSDGLPTTDDLGQFLDAADVAAANQDMAALQKAIAAAAKNRRRLRFTPGMSRDAAEWKRQLEERIAEGWTGQGQTNDLLKDFAQYGHVFLHLRGDALDDYVEAAVKAAPGYERYCRHQHEIRRRIADRARGVDNGWNVPYRGFPKRDGRSYRENFEQPQNNIVRLENQANVNSRQQAAERIRQAMAHLQATDTLPYGATTRAAAIIATVKELTGRGMSLATLHRSCHLPLWHPGSKLLEPAQGAILHPTLESAPEQKSLEPAQGGILHPNPLYEGKGQDGLPPSPLQGEGGQQPIQPDFEQGGVSEGGNLPVSAPATQEQPIDQAPLTTPAVSEVLQDQHSEASGQELETSLAAPVVSSGSKIPLPPGASPETIRHLTRIWLAAGAHAEKAVRIQQLAEIDLFDADERKHRETVAKMQFFWKSGEPLLMAEVKAWLAADPSRKLNL
jgi:hypothetical protein